MLHTQVDSIPRIWWHDSSGSWEGVVGRPHIIWWGWIRPHLTWSRFWVQLVGFALRIPGRFWLDTLMEVLELCSYFGFFNRQTELVCFWNLVVFVSVHGSPEELTRLLNDKDAYSAFLHSLDEVRRLDKVCASLSPWIWMEESFLYRCQFHMSLEDHGRLYRRLVRICVACVLSNLSDGPFFENCRIMILVKEFKILSSLGYF